MRAEPPAMKRLRMPVATIVATAVIGALLVSCGDRQSATANGKKPATQSEPAAAAAVTASANPASEADKALRLTPAQMQEAGVRVETIQPSSVNASITLSGTVSPNQNRIAKVIPRLPGRITSVPAALGAHVKAGQTLAVLESIELGDVRSTFLQARSEASVADAALARAKSLSAEDIIPRKDYLRARADAQRAHAALQAASDKLRILGVSPTVSESGADAVYSLVAPLAGTVIEKQAVPGTLADKESLFTVADLSNVWVVADVFERDLSRLAVGAAAEVTVAAYPDERFAGQVVYLSATLDVATRTVKAQIELPNPQRRLKPGMFASASVATSATEPALVLPAAAVTLVDGKPTVFIETKTGFEPRSIETSGEVAGMVTVRQGLTGGERVAIDGVYALKSRMLKSQLGSTD